MSIKDIKMHDNHIVNAEKPNVEVVDTAKEFKWRMFILAKDASSVECSPWSSHYPGILKHKFSNGETWYYASAYWEGTLPIETPFQLKEEV